jgi:hypothetical protein
MALELRSLDRDEEKGVNRAAALAKKQLEYAEAIVDAARPGRGNEPVLIAAVLQAIAINYAHIVGE